MRGRGDIGEQLLQEGGQELVDPLPGHLPQPLGAHLLGGGGGEDRGRT